MNELEHTKSGHKILIFGAGRAGRGVLDYYKTNYSVEAFVDSDTAKVGTTISGIPILEPSKICDANYDFIVVASMYSEDIVDMLVNTYGVDEQKVKLAPSSISLASHSPDRAKLRQTLINVVKFLNAHNVDYYLDSSALLSIVRSGDFLPWAHGGVDISIVYRDFLPGEIIEFLEANTIIGYSTLQVNRFEISYGPWEKGDVKGITLLDDGGRSLSTLSFRYQMDDYLYTLAGPYVLKYPLELIVPQKIIKFEICDVKVPYLYENYLAYVYGHDWRVPQKNWHWSNYANIHAKVL